MGLPYGTNPLLYQQSMYAMNKKEGYNIKSEGRYGMEANSINSITPLMRVGNYAFIPYMNLISDGSYAAHGSRRFLNSPYGSFDVTTNNLGSSKSIPLSFNSQRQTRNRFGK